MATSNAFIYFSNVFTELFIGPGILLGGEEVATAYTEVSEGFTYEARSPICSMSDCSARGVLLRTLLPPTHRFLEHSFSFTSAHRHPSVNRAGWPTALGK